MKILYKQGKSDLATVYVAQNDAGKKVEFVESIQPPIPIEKKWVLIISTLFGCPVSCPFCDAGGFYKGKLSFDELIFQIDHMIKQRFPDGKVITDMLKIQFARMGEPAFNDAVLDVLEQLPNLYDIPTFFPSISTVAPFGRDAFFERLLNIKNRLYNGRFQFQYSLHSSSPEQNSQLIPIKKWTFEKMADYGNSFFKAGDRKITLNFALTSSPIIEADILKQFFDPKIFLIKLTPVNPTLSSINNNIKSFDISGNYAENLKLELQSVGYDVILSIGELEEKLIGSNCGQYVTSLEKNNTCALPDNAYTYSKKIFQKV